MPWRFWDRMEIEDMRAQIRNRRAAMYWDQVPESLADVQEARIRLATAMEISVELIEAAQMSIHYSWKAIHALNKVVKEAAAAREAEVAAAAEEADAAAVAEAKKTPRQQRKKTPPQEAKKKTPRKKAKKGAES